MNWKVTYRGRDGRLATAFYEATDRATLFRTLEAAGVSAVKVEAAESGVGRTAASKGLFPAWGREHAKALSVVGIALILVAVTIAIFVSRPREGTGKEGPVNGRGLILETNGVHKAPAAPKALPPKVSRGVVTNFVNNVWHDDKGRPHYKVTRVIRPGQKTVINGKPWRPEKPVFRHPCEVELDVLLSRRPGERIFGDVNWQAFRRDLPNALADKIEIHPSDTPDVIARKKAVMEAKEELAAAIRDGEDPCEILKAARDDVNRLADVRDNLLVAVAEMRQDGASEQEIEDAVVAANRILESHGIDQPLVSPRTMRERAEAARARKLLKQKGKQP